MTRKPLLLVLASMPLAATPAFAAEGGGLLDPNAGLIFWQIVVFVVVLAALLKFAYPHILGAVEAREQRIRELLASAERDRQEAAALIATQREEHEKLRSQAQDILADARASGERAREEMLAQARRETEEMLDRARRDIEAQTERALDALRRDAVDIAIAAAEKLVRQNLDDEQNRRLVREFLGEVEGRTATAGV